MTLLSSPSKLSTWFFGQYDIRAVVGDGFNAQTYTDLGRAYAHWLRQRLGDVTTTPWLAVGHDVRLHAPELYQALLAGLNAGGISTLTLGMVPSPVAYLAEVLSNEDPVLPSVVGTLVVTASHNPAPYNGLKFTLNGVSFTQEDLASFKAEYALGGWQTGPAFEAPPETRAWDALSAYRAWAKTQFSGFATAPRVVVDCGNGTAGLLIRDLLEAADCHVIGLYEEPDGHFPNHHPDPCAHHNLVDLQATVLREGADLGIAFDGDSDRLGVVDSQGRIIAGDIVLILYTQALMAVAPQGTRVVSEVKCSQHLFDQIQRLGAQAIMSRTGHAFIKQRMRAEDALLGGELSGHFFFRDRHYGFDDAFYAALRLIELLDQARQRAGSPIGLAALTEQLPHSCLSEEARIHLEKVHQPAVMAALAAEIEGISAFAGLPVQSIVTIDGLRVNLDGGFWLVRQSNTEPCFTLRFEAPDPATLQQLEQAVLALLNNAIQSVTQTRNPED